MKEKEKTASSLDAVPEDKVTSDIHTGTNVQNNSESSKDFQKNVSDGVNNMIKECEQLEQNTDIPFFVVKFDSLFSSFLLQ